MADEDKAVPDDKAAAEAQSGTYDQACFLDLAEKGKEEWNKWRHANKDARVTFEGVDFSEARKDRIDFSGYEFGHNANFSKCKWRGAEWRECEDNRETFTVGRACFTNATFGHGARFYSSAFGKGADFSGVKFDHGASFPNAIFGHGAFFKDAVFGHRASFDSAAFGNGADFDGAAFGGEASFNGATFGNWATFIAATFGDLAQFINVTFGNGAKFEGVGFAGRADFTSATFGGDATFTGAAFGLLANFDNAHFKGIVAFTGKSQARWARDIARADGMDDEVRAALEKRHRESWELNDSGPERFLIASFANTRFDRSADFSSRTFGRITDFTGTRFYQPPVFDAAASDSLIDFTGAHIGFAPPGKLLHWTEYSRIPLCLRALRKLAEDTKNHDLERDLYIEERKAERGVYWRQLLDELKKAPKELKKKLEDIDEQQREVWSNWRHRARARNAHRLGNAVKIARLFAHLLWILLVMGGYWVLADYGRSLRWPALWLASSVFFFHEGYVAILAPLMHEAGPANAAKYARAEWMVALGNAVPFVGPLTIDGEIKRFLFCPGCADKIPAIPPEGFQFLVIFQNLFSITCVFFIALALRNYFKIK
jgi:hypothetical protein